MPLILNTNSPSLNAQRNLNTSANGLSIALQRLASGLRINSAKDDAAGLAISERMTSQVRGQQAAARNANDAISLAQTAEGAMQEMSNILQRCRELSVQAANGTNSRSDRQALEQELTQLLAEFDRISTTTEFNGTKLLDGSFTGQNFQVGANSGEVIGVSIPNLRKDELGYYRLTSSASPIQNSAILGGSSSVTFFNVGYDFWNLNDRTMEINGQVINVPQNTSAGELSNKINAIQDKTNVTANAYTNIGFYADNGLITLRLVAGEDYSKAKTVSFNWDGSDSSVQAAMRAINAVSSQTGVVAEDFLSDQRMPGAGGMFRLASQEGKTLHVMNDSDPSLRITFQDSDWNDFQGPILNGFYYTQGSGGNGVFGTDDMFAVGGITLESSSSIDFVADGYLDVYGDPYGFFQPDDVDQSLVSLSDVSFVSAYSAGQSIKVFDGALQQLSNARAELGAIQSRLETTISNLQTSTENLSASRSRIQDADFAAETAALTRQQILQQAGTAMLAQANQIPQQILTLLK